MWTHDHCGPWSEERKKGTICRGEWGLRPFLKTTNEMEWYGVLNHCIFGISSGINGETCTRGFHIFHQQRAQQERGQHVPWARLGVSGGISPWKFASTFWIQRLVPGKGQCHILSVRPELIPCRDGRYEENQAGIPKQRYAAIWYTNKKCKFRLYLLVKCSIHLLLMRTIRDMTQLWRSFGYQSITARLYSLPSVVTTPGKPRKSSKKSRRKERCSTKNRISTEDWSRISKCCRYLSYMCYMM